MLIGYSDVQYERQNVLAAYIHRPIMNKAQRVIIRFLHLRGMKPIEIHRQLRETCSDGVMDVKNVRSWVRQFKEGRTSCDVGRSSSKVS